jgi:HD-GYP domain-containing protein (c-di-GMP phosphodiesterase class II)
VVFRQESLRLSEIFRKACARDFELGKPLPWPLYDDSGLLLLRQGYVILMPGLIERLLTRGCYIGPPNTDAKKVILPGARHQAGSSEAEKSKGLIPSLREKKPVPVFLRSLEMLRNVRRIHKLLREPPSARLQVPDYITEQAQSLLGLIAEDKEAVLAALYLGTDTREYRPAQQQMGAALVGFLAPLCGFDPAQTASLVCAALTRDIGLAQFDEIAVQFSSGLPEAAHRIIQSHPQLSVELLKRHGVEDPLWLLAIEQHHERPDGHGYPHQLSGGELHPGGQLLNLVDSYASMVLQRQHAQSLLPANALKALFLEKGTRYDEKQLGVLFKTLTRFPVGTLVRLANGEIGVVFRSDDKNPEVHSLYDGAGMQRSLPLAVDVSKPENAIMACVLPQKCKSAQLVIRRLWQGAPVLPVTPPTQDLPDPSSKNPL